MDAIVNVVDNNITAETTLNDLTMELKWSDIGKFPVNLLQVSLIQADTYHAGFPPVLQASTSFLPLYLLVKT